MSRRPAVALFLCLFAAQASYVALTPILTEVAREFGVSSAAAGQLRTVSAIAGGLTALVVGRSAARLGVRDLLLAGLGLLAVGGVASAAAPAFGVLAAAQLVVGTGVGMVVSAGIAAAGAWAPMQERARVLSWAVLGQPAAWVVGLPLIGLIAQAGWRWAYAVVPLAGSLVAIAATLGRQRDRARTTPATGGATLWRQRGVPGWAAGELLAYTAWSGLLVYAGALFVESYRLSVEATSLALAAAAAAYFPGAFVARRHVKRSARTLLVGLGLACAAAAAAFALVRPASAVSAMIFAALVGVAGARAVAGSYLGLAKAPDEPLAVMGIRAAATQFGYLLGAALGGVALAAGGWSALGVLLGTLFVLATTPHLLEIIRAPSEARPALKGGALTAGWMLRPRKLEGQAAEVPANR